MDQDKKLVLFTLIGAGVALLTRKVIKKINAYDFSGKTALVTGGSRGLGFYLAQQLLKRGATVIICARDKEELVKAKEKLSKINESIFTAICDITKRPEVDQMVENIIKDHGKIDVLINNAGVMQVGPMESMNYEEYDEAFAVHFWGVLHTTMAVIPQMKRMGSGRIINVSSIGGKVGLPHMAPYSASKFALTGYSESIHSELKKDGILVTTAFPGPVNTGGYRHAKMKGNELEEFKWFSEADTMPVLAMKADQVAKNILEASAEGNSEIVISLSTKLVVALQGLFPGLVADMLTLFNYFLPDPTKELSEDFKEPSFLPHNGKDVD